MSNPSTVVELAILWNVAIPTARTKIARLEKQGKRQCVGEVHLNSFKGSRSKDGSRKNAGGHPVNVYMASGAAVPSKNALRHDLLVSKFGLPWFIRGKEGVAVEWQRGQLPWNVDFVLTVEGVQFFGEGDFGTEGVYRQFCSHLQKIAPLADHQFIAVVTSSEARLKTIAREARQLEGSLLLTTVEETRKDCFGTIWQSVHGERTTLF